MLLNKTLRTKVARTRAVITLREAKKNAVRTKAVWTYVVRANVI
jgi:hypothetical protein